MKFVSRVLVGLVLVCAASMLPMATPASHADVNYWVDSFLDSGHTTIPANEADNISTITVNDSAASAVVTTRLWLSQGWFLNGVPTKVAGPATTCASVVGSRVWDCTTTLAAHGGEVDLDFPIVSRACLEAVPLWKVQVWVGGVMHDEETSGALTGGSGRIACSLTWNEQHLSLTNNTSYYEEFVLSFGWASAHDMKIQVGISSNSTMAQFDVIGGFDQAQWFKQPGLVFQQYCTAFSTHTYAECVGSPTRAIWVSGMSGFFNIWYHTFNVDGQTKQWVRAYDAGGVLVYEQIYFANIA
jgi:hypothetical protein